MRGRNILIVDDDAEMRSWLRLGLQRLGAVVQEASSGWECLARLADDRTFDLVVTDMRMPMPSGLSVLAIARSLGLETPFIVITAFSSHDLRERVRAFTAAALVDKPFGLDDLVAAAALIDTASPRIPEPAKAPPPRRATAARNGTHH